MTNAIFRILQRDYGNRIETGKLAKEIAEMVMDFFEWYVTEAQFKYRFGVGIIPNPLYEAFDYWYENIYKK